MIVDYASKGPLEDNKASITIFHVSTNGLVGTVAWTIDAAFVFRGTSGTKYLQVSKEGAPGRIVDQYSIGSIIGMTDFFL